MKSSATRTTTALYVEGCARTRIARRCLSASPGAGHLIYTPYCLLTDSDIDRLLMLLLLLLSRQPATVIVVENGEGSRSTRRHANSPKVKSSRVTHTCRQICCWLRPVSNYALDAHDVETGDPPKVCVKLRLLSDCVSCLVGELTMNR